MIGIHCDSVGAIVRELLQRTAPSNPAYQLELFEFADDSVTAAQLRPCRYAVRSIDDVSATDVIASVDSCGAQQYSTSGVAARRCAPRIDDAVARAAAHRTECTTSRPSDVRTPRTTSSPRILVVDDEKVIRDILADFLAMEGYVVRTAPKDGQAALVELSRTHYDLVISDLKMPNMGGIELLEAIAQHAPQRRHRHHDGLRHGRDRDRRDEARRVRLHPQAVQGRRGHPHRPARPREAAARRPRTSA